MTPVQQIRQHALENYDNGWDYIVECYTDDEIQSEYLDECNGDLEAALKLIESVASIRKDRQEEAQQYIEENKDTQPTEKQDMATTYNGYESYDHWNTALWLNNDEQFYNLLKDKVELVVYMVCTKSQAVYEILRELPEKTPDGATWEADTILDLVDEHYEEQLQYS